MMSLPDSPVDDSAEMETGMHRRHVVATTVSMVVWFFVACMQTNKVAILMMIVIVVVTNVSHYILKSRKLLSRVSLYRLHMFGSLLAAYTLVVTTGGLASPVALAIFHCVAIVCFSGPAMDISIAPEYTVLVSLVLSLCVFEYFGNPFPQFPISEEAPVRILIALTVTLAALYRGLHFRFLLCQSLEKERLTSLAKSRFVANVSHELRTPLTSVLGWTDVLLASDPNETIKPTLEIIKKCGQNLLAIISDILDYSKIEYGRLVFCESVFNLKDVLNDVIQSTSVIVQDGVEFVTDVDLTGIDYVRGDPMRLRQCIFNFISNAAKFTKAGRIELVVTEGESVAAPDVPKTSRITHELAPTFRLVGFQDLFSGSWDELPVRGEAREADLVEIKFVVRDTGIGMDEETVGRLFRPFSQADSSTTKRYGGTGLGLSITKELIEAMRGSVHVESRPGVGTTFTWTVWLAQALLPSPSSNSHKRRSRASSSLDKILDVLLAEDNSFNQQLIKKLLETNNCNVVTVENGVLASQAVLDRPDDFDVVLMDVQMPIMDGLEATRIIRRRGNNAPIIALTANADEGTRKEVVEAGMDGMLTKPIMLDDLQRLLWRIRRRRPGTPRKLT